MYLKNLFVGAAVTLWSALVVAGPFGLEKGMTLDQLRAVGVEIGQQGGPVVKTVKVPKPHPAFEQYMLLVDDKLGLCKIIATGKDVTMSSFGTELISEFEGLRDGLDEGYGKSKTMDFLVRGSIWSDDKDWSTALQKKERVLSAFWGATMSGKQFISKDDVQTVGLDALASSPSVGYVILSYEFKGAKACIEKATKKRNSVL